MITFFAIVAMFSFFTHILAKLYWHCNAYFKYKHIADIIDDYSYLVFVFSTISLCILVIFF